MIWTVTAAVYGVLVTVLYCLGRRAAAAPIAADLRVLWQAARTVELPKDRAEMMKALSELQKAATPWYERTLSTIGVIAFFSMSVAVTVQTIQANLQQSQAERLRAELADQKAAQSASERFVADVARLVASGVRGGGSLSELERKILRHRLDVLAETSDAGDDAVREMFALALTLREYPRAVTLLEQHRTVLDMALPGDRLSLAEYYFLVGSLQASKELVGQVWAQRAVLDKPLVTRLVVLRAALGVSADGAHELAELLGVSSAEATRILARETMAFRAGVARVDAAHAPGEN
ncbi:MAG TPA: hypothetical protein VFS60_09965 [Thermoanaerobaculia bacterium]|nr:hypothetical protein [Thermoanaerobaculia bacterium]